MTGNTRSFQQRLKWQLFGRLLILVLVLMPILGGVRYQIARQSLKAEFDGRINGARQVLEVGLREPLWELDETQIEEAVRALSYLPDLMAVRITESGPSRVERTFVRDEQGQLALLSATTAAQLEAPVQQAFTVKLKDNEPAQGMLFFSDDVYNAAVRDSIVVLFAQMALFAVLVVAMMYYLVQRYVGGPLERLRVALAPDAEPGLLETTVASLPDNELRGLVERYQRVLQDLRAHQQHLTDMVMQRTRALSDANEQLEGEIQRRARIEQELILAREHAEQANEAKTFFLAHMSHELRTPLNGIIGYSQLLSQHTDLEVGVREGVDNIESCAHHLLELVNRILDLTKIEQGRMDRQDQPFGLQRLLNEVTAIVRPKAREKRLTLELGGIDAVPAAVIGDAAKLRQILINLLGNAVKFTEQGSVALHVSVPTAGVVRFIVSDTGPGIAERDLSRIFEPFQQAGNAAQQARQGGTGLGLSIARRLVQLLGGDLVARSALGEGSVFAFELPLPETDSAALPSEARQIIGIDGPFKPRVLVVDDVTHNRDVIKRQLERIGFVVDTSSSAEEALDSLQRQVPDIVFMDIRMPGMDGISCAQIVRERHPKLPLLAFTASVFDAEVNASIRENFDGLVLKPVDIQQACEAIARCLPVRYLFAAQAAVVEEEKPETPASSLSEAELAQLRGWLSSGALTRIRSFAESLKSRDEALGERLHSLARAYDIEGLRRLLT